MHAIEIFCERCVFNGLWIRVRIVLVVNQAVDVAVIAMVPIAMTVVTVTIVVNVITLIVVAMRVMTSILCYSGGGVVGIALGMRVTAAAP